MSLYRLNIQKTAQVEAQPNFPMEDINAKNTEALIAGYRTERNCSVTPAQLTDDESQRLSAGRLVAPVLRHLGINYVSPENQIDLASFERGVEVFEELDARLTSRKKSKQLILPTTNAAVRTVVAQYRLPRNINPFLREFEDNMPNTAKIVEVAAQGHNLTSAKLGALTSRSLALANSLP